VFAQQGSGTFEDRSWVVVLKEEIEHDPGVFKFEVGHISPENSVEVVKTAGDDAKFAGV
jgi:hypothetical protein